MKKIEKYFFVIVLLEIISLLLINLLPIQIIYRYVINYILSSLLFFISVGLLLKIELKTNYIFLFVIIAFAIRLSFLFTDPIGSDDVYRYMWDGKLQSGGINPYLYKPLDEKLNSFHSDLLPEAMNFKEMRTIYFPISQWLFFLGYKLSGENVWGYKLLLLLFEMFTIFLLYRLLPENKKKIILIYALCPLPIIHFALDAHLDGFGLPILLLAIYFYLRDRKILSLIFLGLSFSIKPVGVVLIPVFFLMEKGLFKKLRTLLIPIITFFIQFIPYIFTSNPFEAFLIYSKHWFYNGFIFNLLNSFIHNNQTSRMVCSVLLLISLLPLYLSKKDLMDKIYYSVLLLLIFSPVVHPWYVTWLLIMAVVNFRWSGIWFIAFSSLTALTILTYKTQGIWVDYWWIQIIEFLPVFALLFLELFSGGEFKTWKVKHYFLHS